MPPIKQEAIGQGIIAWLGINREGHPFSLQQPDIDIVADGIAGDKYRGIWRKLGAHDGDYVATDGVGFGDQALNLRQITIVDTSEVMQAAKAAGVSIDCGMLRENIVVRFEPLAGIAFSKLPPLSRMVIGDSQPKVLIITEENGPCAKIAKPIARENGNESRHPAIRDALRNHRGQMAMVRSFKSVTVHVGTSFLVYPPLT